MNLRPLAVCLVAATAVSGADRRQAFAQSDDDLAGAERLFNHGVAALERGEPARARDFFKRSLARVDTEATRINLAVAHQLVDEPREALDVLEAVDPSNLAPEQGEVVQQMLIDLQALVGSLRVTVHGVEAVEVFVDGESRGFVGSRPVTLLVNPRAHVVRATAGSEVREHVAVDAGETVRVSLELTPVEETSSLTWLWITLTGVAVAAAGLAVALVVTKPFAGDPIEDDPITGRARLTLRF